MRLAAALLLGIVCSTPARAQTPEPSPPVPSSQHPECEPDQPQAPAAPRTHRWIDLQAATLDTRYRYVETSTGVVTSNQMQHKQTLRLGFRIDPAGRYSVQTFSATGSSFTGSWDPLGPGTGEPTWDFTVRQLYVSAEPIDGLELQAGGLTVVRGEQTEVTSYDNDAYIEGYRGSVKRPADLHLDEVSVTIGYLGDLNTPNVFRRLDRMDDWNYSNVLVARRFGRVGTSADWTSENGISTFRQAVRVATSAWMPIDSVRFEQYERVEGMRGYGFAIVANRTITPRVSVMGGFAAIDRNSPPVNGDRFGRGRHVAIEARFLVRPELVLSSFYTHGFSAPFLIGNRDRFDLVLSYDVLKVLRRAGAW